MAGTGTRRAPTDKPEVDRKTLAFLNDYAVGLGASKADVEARSLQQGLIKNAASPQGFLAIPTPDGGAPFYPALHKDGTYADARAVMHKQGGFTGDEAVDAAVAKHYGASEMSEEIDDRFVKDAQAQQTFQGGLYNAMNKRVHTVLQGAGREILSDDPSQEIMDIMGVTAEKLRAKYGNAPADGFQAEITSLLGAGKVKEAMDKIGMTEAQVRNVVPSEAGFDVPLLKDMPVWGQGLAIAGAGAAGGALAYHLMSQGQQQQSATDYAVAMQALNAY